MTLISTSRRLGVVLTAILFAGNLAPAIEPITWKWTAGDTARYQLTKTVTMTMEAGPAGALSTTRREDQVLAWTVDAIADGATGLLQSTERVVLATSGPMGQSFRYDSQDEEPPAGMAALVAPMFEAMIADPIQMTMAPTGEIKEVTLTDDLADSLGQLPGGGVSEETVVEATKQGSLAFPEKPLEEGDSWDAVVQIDTPQMGLMKVTTTYVYNGPKDVEGRTLESFTPSMKMESLANPQGAEVSIDTKSTEGEILFDAEAGRLVSSRVKQTLEVLLKLGEQEARNVVEQSTEMRELAAGEEPAIEAEPAETAAAD